MRARSKGTVSVWVCIRPCVCVCASPNDGRRKPEQVDVLDDRVVTKSRHDHQLTRSGGGDWAEGRAAQAKRWKAQWMDGRI